MGSRLDLQTILETILGSRNVYYQPPVSLIMKYPAIVYSRDDIKGVFANDGIYTINKSYELIIIDKNPDSIIIDKILTLPSCRFVRNYTSDNLNHDVFIIRF